VTAASQPLRVELQAGSRSGSGYRILALLEPLVHISNAASGGRFILGLLNHISLELCQEGFGSVAWVLQCPVCAEFAQYARPENAAPLAVQLLVFWEEAKLYASYGLLY
jgi:hypothetical protein